MRNSLYFENGTEDGATNPTVRNNRHCETVNVPGGVKPRDRRSSDAKSTEITYS